MLGMGAYTPLDGFMGYDDWCGSVTEMRLTNGVFWPLPITLSVAKDVANSIGIGEEVALSDGESGDLLGTLMVREKYGIDRELECKHVFRTTDPKHPGVDKVMRQGQVNIGGPITAFSEGEYPAKYKGLYLRPEEARAQFEKRGWKQVAAFQTRNPMHRSHEHLAKIAAEVTDGVFIHQVLGKLKAGDIPAEVRTRAIQAMIDNYFKPNIAIQAGYPIQMRYAGPREALIHALIRQNFGCSHLVVGRDHAGVGSYYGPLDAQHIFDQLWTARCYASRSRSTLPSIAISAPAWPPARRARMIPNTTSPFPAPANARCFRKARRCRPSSAGQKWSPSSENTTGAWRRTQAAAHRRAVLLRQRQAPKTNSAGSYNSIKYIGGWHILSCSKA